MLILSDTDSNTYLTSILRYALTSRTNKNQTKSLTYIYLRFTLWKNLAYPKLFDIYHTLCDITYRECHKCSWHAWLTHALSSEIWGVFTPDGCFDKLTRWGNIAIEAHIHLYIVSIWLKCIEMLDITNDITLILKLYSIHILKLYIYTLIYIYRQWITMIHMYIYNINAASSVTFLSASSISARWCLHPPETQEIRAAGVYGLPMLKIPLLYVYIYIQLCIIT